MSECKSPDLKRRSLCGHLLLAVATPALAGPVLARSGEKVDEDAAAAAALGYRHDAKQVDTKAFPKRAGAQGARQFCDNCALFEGETGEPWAPCGLFQGRLVAAKGWCNAWVSRA